MAPLAGLLIEYFVAGAVASLWLGPLLIEAIPPRINLPKELFGIIAATLVPALYLAGMVCDLIGYQLLHHRKEEIEGGVRREAKLGKFSAQRVHALAIAYEPELAKELGARSTRDRIARSSLIASIPMLWLSPFEGFGRIVATSIAVVVIVALYLLWYRMQTLSAKYEVEVVHVLYERHKVNVGGELKSDA